VASGLSTLLLPESLCRPQAPVSDRGQAPERAADSGSLLSKRGRMTSLRSLVSTLALPALLLIGCTAVNSLHLPNLSDASREAGAPPPGPIRAAVPPADGQSAGVETTTEASQPVSEQAAAAAALEAFRQVGELSNASGYRLGAGDLITISVWGRDDLSGPHAIGPDGTITLPVVGDLSIGGLDRSAALEAIRASLTTAYPDLVVTMRVDDYQNLRVVVLGEVASPGELTFSAPPDLLRAIGGAGGVKEPTASASEVDQPHLAAINAERVWKATIMRGREAVLWVDLNALLREGDMSLNVPLVTGDVIHISTEAPAMIYVLGQVGSPGIFPLRQGATVIDALAMAGGTTEDADDDGVRLLRPARGQRSDFDYDDYALGSFELNMSLAAGDVIYVPTSWAGEIGYFLSKFSPLSSILIFSRATRN